LIIESMIGLRTHNLCYKNCEYDDWKLWIHLRGNSIPFTEEKELNHCIYQLSLSKALFMLISQS